MQRRLVIAIGAVLTVLAVSCGDDEVGGDRDLGADVVSTGYGPFEFGPARPDPVEGPVFLVPGDLDLPFEIGTALISDDSGGNDMPATVIVLGVPTDNGAEGLVVIGIEHVDDRSSFDDNGGYGFSTVDINGVEGRLSDDETVAATIEWYTEGRSAVVLGPEGATDLVLEVARSVDPSKEGAAALPDVPDGRTVLAAAHVGAEALAAMPARDANNWLLSLDVAGEQVSISGSPAFVDFLPLILAVSGGGALEQVDVRGTGGAWMTQDFSSEGTDDVGVIESSLTTLMWIERPGFEISVRGDADLDTLIAVAESLVEVSAAEFDSYRPGGTPLG